MRGRLYGLPYGFPAIVVPEADVLATGTTDYLTDTNVQNRTPASLPRPANSPRWDTVHGELFSFDDPEERLPALDGLEGFRPGEESLYRRVLVSVTLLQTGKTVPAWTYVIKAAYGLYLPDGRWPPP